MKKLTQIILLFCVLTYLNSKAQTWSWVKTGIGSGNGDDEGWAVSTDTLGNAFITGFLHSPTTTFGTYTLTNTGMRDVFLAKYDSNGNVLWAKNAVGGNEDRAFSVCNDNAGNAFITGAFRSPTISFGSYSLTCPGFEEIFLAKYDANGNELWAKGSISSNANGTYVYSVHSDKAGNSYITGHFDCPSVVFGTYTLTGSGFFVKYDPNGNIVWAKNLFGSNSGYSISSDMSGNMYLAGYINGPNMVLGTYTLSNATGCNVFLAKYDVNGNVLWVKGTTGTGVNQTPYSISTDPIGNTYMTGSFNGPTISFGVYTLTLPGNATENTFLVKYDTNGNELWAKSIEGGQNRGYTVSSNPVDVFVAGFMGNYYCSFGTYTLNVPSGSVDPMYIARYDKNGNFINATALNSGGDDNNGISLDKFCNLYVCSDFETSPFIVGSNNFNPVGQENVFLAKLSFACQPDGLKSLTNNEDQIFIYPNPTSNKLFISSNQSDLGRSELEIINCFGQVVLKTIYIDEINISSLSQGTYFLRIKFPDSSNSYSKFVKE